MENTYSEEYKEKQAAGTLQKKYLERSYKIARGMFDSLPPKESSLFHPRKHDDKIEVEITTLHPYVISYSQSNQQARTVPRSPNSSTKTNISNFYGSNSKSINKTPTKNYSQYHISEPASEKKSRDYYHFLDEYSSSFMNSNSSTPNSPSYIYKYGDGHNSYYYTEYEPRVSKHFSPSKQSSSPVMPDNFRKSHTSPPSFRHHNQSFNANSSNQFSNGSFNQNPNNSSNRFSNGSFNQNPNNSSNRFSNGSFNQNPNNSTNKIPNGSFNQSLNNSTSKIPNGSFNQNSNNSSNQILFRNVNENDERKNVGVQRADSGKYQYEEESFLKSKVVVEEEEEVSDDQDINSSFKMTASKMNDVFNDEQLMKDRELLRKNMGIDFHHNKWNGEAEPNPEIDDTKLDQRVKMIISKLKEQNSLSAQNSQLNDSNEMENPANSDDDGDAVIFLNDDIDNSEIKNQNSSKKPNFNLESANISKQNMQKIYSADSSLPQNLITTQTDYAIEIADTITHTTNQKIIDLNNK